MTSQTSDYQNDIYQLDQLIIDLYNVTYSKSIDFENQFIDINNLKMKMFKLTDYDLDMIFEKTPIQYIGNSPTGISINDKDLEQILFKRQGDSFMSTIRIIPYPHEKSLNDMTDPVNVNQILKTILSELVINEKTDGLLLPIINVDVKGSDLINYNKVAPYIDENKYYSIQITEKFHSITNLNDYFKKYPIDSKVVKTIISQVVKALYQINLKYPNFRHNNLVPEMIDCYLKKEKDTIYPKIKINNFFLSQIKPQIINSYLKTNSIDFIDSNYSDLYQLLNSLWNNYQIDFLKNNEIKSMFDKFLPEKIRSDQSRLTLESWNTLNDDEKFELDVKNLQSHDFFEKENFSQNATFVDNRVKKNDNIIDDILYNTDNEGYPMDIHMPTTKNDAILNKKNSEYGIGIMKKNKNDGIFKDNKFKDDVFKDDLTEEIPDENESYDKKNFNRVSQKKPKTYHGKRKIQSNYPNNRNNLKDFIQKQPDYFMNKPYYNPTPTHDNSFVMNGVPSRINSIGNTLGVSPADFANRGNNNMPYSQIVQQMQQQQLPQQQIPVDSSMLMQNQLTGQQMPQQQNNSDMDAYYRYLATIGQLPQLPQNNMQPTQDPNIMAMLMQQQNQNTNPVLPQNIIPQSGGNKNFFF